MKDYAIYTAVVGEYDNIRQPIVVDERFDYILFSNDVKEENIGVWQVRPIPYYNNIQTKIARWVKTHPEELLSAYNYTIWIDANLQIKSQSFYNHIIDIAGNNYQIACRKHPERDCVYDEIALCSFWHLEYEKILLRWARRLTVNKYPSHNGLFETCILFRKNDKSVQQFDQRWWSYIENFSRRDQLSFVYSLWELKMECHKLLPDDFDTDNSSYYNRYRTHGNESKKRIPFISRNFPFLYWYLKTHPERNTLYELDNIRRIYDRFCAFPNPYILTLLFRQYYRILLKAKGLFNKRKKVALVREADYARWIDQLKTGKDNFVPFTEHSFERHSGDPKVYAFYLTQFHAIPENDHAHGKGFTEWTNVAAATPQFVGHYQPKIPYDLGFYNLLTPGIMERQVEIAKAYGVYGFCFYYYWFSGRKLLEKPLEYFLHSDIDFHFHLCWATENWSKRWDGGENELIVEQKLQDDDADKFFSDLLPYISDPRYERIGGKPVLIIYRVDIFEQDKIKAFLSRLNDLAVNHGFAGLHILCTNAFGFCHPLYYGCSGLVEFPPHGIIPDEYKVSRPILSPQSDFSIVDMSAYIRDGRHLYNSSFPLFKTCFPEWDNTPRKLYNNGYCFLMEPSDFRQWLTDNINWTRENHGDDEQIVYINAWNEWGEGAILEPTVRYGYRNLEVLKETLESCRK